jgi:hypothetical protein
MTAERLAALRSWNRSEAPVPPDFTMVFDYARMHHGEPTRSGTHGLLELGVTPCIGPVAVRNCGKNVSVGFHPYQGTPTRPSQSLGRIEEGQAVSVLFNILRPGFLIGAPPLVLDAQITVV